MPMQPTEDSVARSVYTGERFLHAHLETDSSCGLHTLRISVLLQHFLVDMFGPLSVSVTASSKKSGSNTAASTPEQGPTSTNRVPISPSDYLPEAYITGVKVHQSVPHS